MNRFTRIKNFHADRLKGVGSSDMPILAGMYKHYTNDYTLVRTGETIKLPQTALTLFRVKTGRVMQIDREPISGGRAPKRWGNRLEPLILMDHVTERYGEALALEFYRNATRAEPVSTGDLKIKTECWHPKYNFAYAHADLLDLINDPLLVEAKASGMMGAKRRESGGGLYGWDPDDTSQEGCPDPVLVQIQWQLFCYGMVEAIANPLIDTSDLRTYGPIIADPRRQEEMLALAERFWWHVEHDKEPQPTTWDDVVSLSPTLTDTTKIITSGETEMEIRAMIDEGTKIKERKKELDARLEKIKMGLGILAGDVEEVEEDGKKIQRWTGTARKVLATMTGDTLATFRDGTKDTLTLSDLLGEVERKKKAGLALDKKAAKGKDVSNEEWDALELTPQEVEAVELDARLRALGAYKTSAPFRVVNY